MANETKSNGTSPSHLENISEKASAPSPSSTPSKESDPPEEAPSKSSPPPLAPPPHSPPPPSPSPSPPPPPPPQAQVPPPHSSPPPSKVSPSPPPPPPSSSPPTPPSSPSWSPPSPPASDNNSPPPSQSNSPPSPPSSKIYSLSSPSSHISPPQSQNRPSLPQSPSPSSHSKPSSSPSKSSSLSKSSSSQDNTGQYIGLAFAAIFVLAFMAIIFALVIRRKDKRGNFYDVHYYVESPGFAYSHGNNGGLIQHLRTPSDSTPQMSAGHILFSYDQVLEITNGFSSENVIGEGGFGRVYKALMPDGRVGAVKLLKAGSGQGEREFRAEVDTISRVHHRHLVSLIGYCLSERQRVLIYEFVPNGNLDQHLHESEWNVLDWPKRMKIAIGAARGLAYLHEGCNPKIIHRDIKSANILLDNAYEAQVADFGLARLTDDAYTHVSTRVMGTFGGYMAPEYATSGKLTDRSDVFSFGVVLLELVTGRKPVDPTQPVGDESLVEWARPLLLRAIETGDFSELVDPRLQRQYVESEMVRMIEAAAACVRHSAPKRPRMVQIARALDSGDQLYDLSNGVKYGQSTVYDSGQYNEDIMRFKRMANGSFVDSEFDMYSSEYSSGDMSRSIMVPQSSSDHLDIKAMQN
nr:nodulation protein [Melilotus officinalis]